jgi:Tol biopolymer transport system component
MTIKCVSKKWRLITALFISAVILLSVFTIVGKCSASETKDDIKHLSFSHDGKKILFARKNDATPSRIHVYDLETGELSVYQQPDSELWTQARYSNDGKKIVFVIIPKIDKSLDLANMQIAIMDPDGKNVKKITSSPGTRIYPSFSHSGKKIIFARASDLRESGKTPAAGYDVYELDIKTGEEIRLTHFRFFEMSPPYYFPDDKAFVFSAYGPPTRFPGIPDKDYKTIQKKQKEHESKWGRNENVYVMQKGQQDLSKLQINLEDYKHRLTDYERSPIITANGCIFFMTQAYKPDGSGDWEQCFEYSKDGKHRRITNIKAKTIWSVAVSPDEELLGFVYTKKGDTLFQHYFSPDIRRIVIYKVKDGTNREIILPDKPTKIIN